MDDADRIAEAIVELADAFPKHTLTEGQLRTYVKQLGAFPIDVVLAALDAAPLAFTWFPAVHEIVSMISESALGDDEGAADLAWIEVQRVATTHGANRLTLYIRGVPVEPEPPSFSSAVIAAAVESIGWKVICTGDNSSGKIGEQFRYAYRRLARTARQRVTLGQAGKRLSDAISQNASSANALAETSESVTTRRRGESKYLDT